MHDSNSKNKTSRKKTLSNSLRLKSPHSVRSRQSVSSILNRLPFLHQLNQTQTQLLKLTPIWQQWCAKQDCSDQISSEITDFASLSSIDGSTLSISCTQSSTATILKHQHNSLLKELKAAGFDQIQSIRIQMSLGNQTAELNDYSDNPHVREETSHTSNSPTVDAVSWPKPSTASIKSIEATQSLIKNEQLAESLKRLAETLKKAN